MTPALKQKLEADAKGRYVWYSLAAVAGANTGFILSLLGTLNWMECLILIVVLATLAGGAVFTFFEMRGLENRRTE
jgi:nicotinamide riboside transporter PnuC